MFDKLWGSVDDGGRDDELQKHSVGVVGTTNDIARERLGGGGHRDLKPGRSTRGE